MAEFTSQIVLPIEEIAVFCQRWQVSEFALFGSVLREDFRPDSDVDVLLSFHEEAHPTLFGLVRIGDQLETIFGRKVDVLTRRGVEESQNHIRRKSILDSAQVIYAK